MSKLAQAGDSSTLSPGRARSAAIATACSMSAAERRGTLSPKAAAIDGARPWRRFWTIQFPLLSPTTFFLLVINIIYAFFDTFAIVDAATSGGPGKDTAILVYKLYYDAFKALDLGASAAQSVVLMAIVIALTVVQFRFVEKKVTY